jgi:hypothetical protein
VADEGARVSVWFAACGCDAVLDAVWLETIDPAEELKLAEEPPCDAAAPPPEPCCAAAVCADAMSRSSVKTRLETRIISSTPKLAKLRRQAYYSWTVFYLDL